jgi:hypothetical protein
MTFPFTTDNLQNVIFDILIDNMDNPLTCCDMYTMLRDNVVEDEFGIANYLNSTIATQGHKNKIIEQIYLAFLTIENKYDNIYRYYYYNQMRQNVILICSERSKDEIRKTLELYEPKGSYFKDYMIYDFLNFVLLNKKKFNHDDIILGKPISQYASDFPEIYTKFKQIFGLDNKGDFTKLNKKIEFLESELAKQRKEYDNLKFNLDCNSNDCIVATSYVMNGIFIFASLFYTFY